MLLLVFLNKDYSTILQQMLLIAIKPFYHISMFFAAGFVEMLRRYNCAAIRLCSVSVMWHIIYCVIVNEGLACT